MLQRHELPDGREMIGQHRLTMRDLHEGDETRHDAALRASLAAEVHGAGRDAFVYDILEEANVRAEAAVIERGIHLLGNPSQHVNLAPYRRRNRAERIGHRFAVSISERHAASIDRRENLGRYRLDLYMDEDEPVLVVEMNKVLQRVDIAKGDRSIRIEALPVVERVSVVTQNRWPAEQRADLDEGRGEIRRQLSHWRLRDLIDIGRCEKADADVIEVQLRQLQLFGHIRKC